MNFQKTSNYQNKLKIKTYLADCRKIAAVDSHNPIVIKKKISKKIDFCIKTF